MRIDGRELAAIFAGGFVGAIARAEVGEALPYDRGHWPWATFMVNVLGACILGWLVAWLEARDAGPSLARPLIGTGFCGALTTFSTMQLELLAMLDAGRVGLALGYASASVLVGLLAVAVATRAVRGSVATT